MKGSAGQIEKKQSKMTSRVDNKNGWLRAKCQPPLPPSPPQHCASALISAVVPPLPLPRLHSPSLSRSPWLCETSSLCRPSTHLADAAVSYFFPHFHFIFHFSCNPPTSPPSPPATPPAHTLSTALPRSFVRIFFFFHPLVSLRSFSHFYFDCKTHFYSPCRA